MGLSTYPARGNDDSWTVAPDGSPAHKASALYLDSDGVTPQKVTASSGSLSINGIPVGGGGAFDNTGTTLVSTTVQAAIVELSAKIDAINAALT
jgi:hypothetical protein